MLLPRIRSGPQEGAPFLLYIFGPLKKRKKKAKTWHIRFDSVSWNWFEKRLSIQSSLPAHVHKKKKNPPKVYSITAELYSLVVSRFIRKYLTIGGRFHHYTSTVCVCVCERESRWKLNRCNENGEERGGKSATDYWLLCSPCSLFIKSQVYLNFYPISKRPMLRVYAMDWTALETTPATLLSLTTLCS